MKPHEDTLTLRARQLRGLAYCLLSTDPRWHDWADRLEETARELERLAGR